MVHYLQLLLIRAALPHNHNTGGATRHQLRQGVKMNTRRNALLPPQSSADRQAAFKQRQVDMGRVKRPLFATPDEHTQVNLFLDGIRK